MIIDKAEWHLDGIFPKDVSPFQAYVHTGFFLGWAIHKGIVSESFSEEYEEDIAEFLRQELSGPALFERLGGVLTSDEVNESGNMFVSSYYMTNKYFEDYEATLGRGLPTLYHVTDTPAHFRAISDVLDWRYKEWRVDHAD